MRPSPLGCGDVRLFQHAGFLGVVVGTCACIGVNSGGLVARAVEKDTRATISRWEILTGAVKRVGRVDVEARAVFGTGAICADCGVLSKRLELVLHIHHVHCRDVWRVYVAGHVLLERVDFIYSEVGVGASVWQVVTTALAIEDLHGDIGVVETV